MQSIRVERGECPRVLVVDDQPFIVDLLLRYLGRLGYTVDGASSPAEAEAMLAGRGYDLLIADLGLDSASPGAGLELLDRTRIRFPGLKVMVLTGGGEDDLEQESRRRGADAFLIKPRPLPEIAATIADLLAPARE